MMGVIIKEGGVYVQKNGAIVGPARRNDRVDTYEWRVGCDTYTADGRYDLRHTSALDIVAEYIPPAPPFDPCADVMPVWGMLTEAQQLAIKAAGEISGFQWYNRGFWQHTSSPYYNKETIYRAKPALTDAEKLAIAVDALKWVDVNKGAHIANVQAAIAKALEKIGEHK